jgi:hypothetical protein
MSVSSKCKRQPASLQSVPDGRSGTLGQAAGCFEDFKEPQPTASESCFSPAGKLSCRSGLGGFGRTSISARNQINERPRTAKPGRGLGHWSRKRNILAKRILMIEHSKPGPMQNLLTKSGTWMARPAAFVFVGIYLALWIIFDRESLDFHGAIALITLCITLFIQRSEHRDTQAIQAKLDELLRAQDGARGSLSKIDDQQPEQIES